LGEHEVGMAFKVGDLKGELSRSTSSPVVCLENRQRTAGARPGYINLGTAVAHGHSRHASKGRLAGKPNPCPESPRWHDGRLGFSNWGTRQNVAVTWTQSEAAARGVGVAKDEPAVLELSRLGRD
jgi:hypothetical protein